MKDSTLVKTEDSLQLTPYDEALLEELLKGVEYVDNDMFSDKAFGKKLLDYTGPRVDSAWFFNYLNSRDDINVTEASEAVQLSAEEEKMLFLKYNYLKRKIDILAGLNAPETYGMMIELDEQSQEVRETLVNANLGCVIAMSNKQTFKNLDFSQAISEGMAALARCVDKFDTDKGKFSTYVYRAIGSAFIKEDVRNNQFNSNTVEYDPGKHEPSGEDASTDVERREIAQIIDGVVNGPDSPLTDREKFVINKRYMDGLSLDEVGKLMTPAMAKGSVHYIENIAKSKLREHLEDIY